MKTKKKKTIKKVKKVVKSLEEIPALLENVDKPFVKDASIPESVISNEPPLENPPLEVSDELEILAEEKEPELTNINNCEYRLTVSFNGEVLDCFTNNLRISILSFAREVHTEGFVKITKGQAEFEKKLTLVQLRQLFKDETTLSIFLDTFYSLYGQPSNVQLK